MDSLILQTAIGLVFIFATAAGLVSVITESVSRYIGLRAEYLLRGLRTLLDGGGTFELPLRETVFGYVSAKRKDAAADRVASAGASAAVQAATTAHSAAENKSAADARAAQAARTALTAAQAAAQAAAEPPGGRPPALVAKIMAHPPGPTPHTRQRPRRRTTQRMGQGRTMYDPTLQLQLVRRPRTVDPQRPRLATSNRRTRPPANRMGAHGDRTPARSEPLARHPRPPRHPAIQRTETETA